MIPSLWKLVALGSLLPLGVVATAVLAQSPGGATSQGSAGQAEPAPAPEEPATRLEPPRIPSPEEREARNAAIRAALARPVDLKFDRVSIEDLIVHLRKVMSTPDLPQLPIYVDPVGLSVADKTLLDAASVYSQGRPAGEALREFLATFNLGYAVQHGWLVIDTRAAAADRRIDAVETRLDRLIEALEKRFPELTRPKPVLKTKPSDQ